jgi:hypothetical protein
MGWDGTRRGTGDGNGKGGGKSRAEQGRRRAGTQHRVRRAQHTTHKSDMEDHRGLGGLGLGAWGLNEFNQLHESMNQSMLAYP